MLDSALIDWLDLNADALDQGFEAAAGLLPRLGAAGVFAIGVPAAQGGAGGTIATAIEMVAAIAEHSLTAAFVSWSQRTFIEYLLQGDNPALGERLLPALLDGSVAGATGLSNAMKHLSGLESLQVAATPAADGWRLRGGLPWVTNLRPQGFWVALVAQPPSGHPAPLLAVPHDLAGVERSADLALLGLQSSNTAALGFDTPPLGAEFSIAIDAGDYLPRIRPHFLGLQCGMSVGIARRSLGEAGARLGPGSHVLAGEHERLTQRLAELSGELAEGVVRASFVTAPARLFGIRIALAELAAAALQLELLSLGGRAYLRGQAPGFARRWREQAFLPLITPSVVQLRSQLAQLPGQA